MNTKLRATMSRLEINPAEQLSYSNYKPVSPGCKGICIQRKYPKWSYAITKNKHAFCSECQLAIPIEHLIRGRFCPCCGQQVSFKRSRLKHMIPRMAFSNNNLTGKNQALCALVLSEHSEGSSIKFMSIQIGMDKKKVWEALHSLVNKGFAFKQGTHHLQRTYKLTSAGYTYATGVKGLLNAIEQAKNTPSLQVLS